MEHQEIQSDLNIEPIESVPAARVVNTGAASRIFPDVILPSQFVELVCGRSRSGEQRLMLAVLADAINLLGGYRRSASLPERLSVSEARTWIFTKGVRCPLSFDHVCDALDIDAEGLRGRLSRMVSGDSGVLLRLRLKEASRDQALTLNRIRRRRPDRTHRSSRDAQTRQ